MTTSAGPGTEDFQKRLQRMWQTRPARAASGSTIGGVCAGIGARYKIDPNLVKVAFIVAALFGGSGIVLYIAAWILFPEGSAPAHATGQGHRRWHDFKHSSSHPPTVVAVVVLVVVVSVITPNLAWSGGGLAGLALMLLGWWLLYQRTPIPEPGTSADTLGQRSASLNPIGQPGPDTGSWWHTGMGGAAPTDAAEQFQRWTPRSWLKDESSITFDKEGAATGNDTAATDPPPPSPPSWDPLGVAPFAWDLPEPAPPPTDNNGGGSSRFTPIVFGLAIIATAAAGALAGAVDWMSPAKVASVGLVVLAGGLLIGAFTRRGRGLVPAAVVVAGFVVIASLIDGIGFPSGPVGERDWKPRTTADLKDEYSLAMGNGRLDLTDLDLTENATVSTEIGLGEFTVIAPDGMNIRVDCDVAIGEVKCPDGLDGGGDGQEGPVLTIDMQGTLGKVEVIRE